MNRIASSDKNLPRQDRSICAIVRCARRIRYRAVTVFHHCGKSLDKANCDSSLQSRIKMPSLALENILDVSSTMQYTNNFNRAGDRSVENDVVAKRKTLNPRSQLLSAAP